MNTAPRTYPPKPTDVYLFATCLVDQFMPQAGLDTIALLEREGLRVHFVPQQTCCGQPAYSSGYPQEARAVALQQLQLFTEDWPVVVPSGSCAGMMVQHYPELFADDAALHAQALALVARVFELSEFLVHVAHFQQPDRGGPCTVALHTSCHARRMMDAHSTSSALLQSLSQVTVVQQARSEECCGFGGTFALLHPEISAAMVGDKVAALQATGAATVVSADCGCLLNITGHAAKAHANAAPFDGAHLASFLWARTGPGAGA